MFPSFGRSRRWSLSVGGRQEEAAFACSQLQSMREQVERAIAALIEKGSPKDGKRTELRAVLEQQRDAIAKAVVLGWTPTAIARAIRESGVQVGFATIREYVAEIGGVVNKSAKRKTKRSRRNVKTSAGESVGKPEASSEDRVQPVT